MELWGHINRDRAFYAFIFGYAALVGVIGIALGEADKFVPLVYYPRWIDGLMLIVSVLLGFLALRSLRDPSPLAKLKTDLKAVTTSEHLAGLVLFMTLALFHGVFTSMKTMLPHLTTFHWDAYLANIDAALHGKDAWRWLTFLDPVTYPLQRVYARSWFIFVTLSSFVVCTWPRLRAVRSQFIWTFLLCWSLLGNLMAGLFLSGGPMFYQQFVGSDRFHGLIAHLRTLPETSPINLYPQVLWAAYVQDRSGFGTGISAFPSMHLSMATLFVLLAAHIDRRLAWAFGAYLVVILTGSVHLGWHYAIDGYVSILLTFGLWKAVGWVAQPHWRAVALA